MLCLSYLLCIDRIARNVWHVCWDWLCSSFLLLVLWVWFRTQTHTHVRMNYKLVTVPHCSLLAWMMAWWVRCASWCCARTISTLIYTLFKQVDIRYMGELNPEMVLDVDITTKTGQLVTDCICRSTHRHLLVCEIVMQVRSGLVAQN